jgi:glycosyltransferase involved in cell wall biosynthesis
VEVAIAHDYLTQRGGAEKVVLALHRAFPQAPIHTTLFEPNLTYPEFQDIEVIASPLNKVRPLRRSHRLALPFLAWAAGRIHVPARHTIVSSSGWAHGFRTSGSKIVYCYSPARWLYQTDAYLGSSKLTPARAILKVLSPFLKRWDRRRATTATKYFAISTVVQQRILDTYGIESEVLPAPHSVDTSLPQEPVDVAALGAGSDFYLCISRLLPYKNVDVVVEAFNRLSLPLVVVGTGPEERRLAALAGPNVLMVKNLTDAQMRWLYARTTAVVSASFEDFGLTPIEGANYGRPAVVLRWGGFLDTIREGATGVYFEAPDPDELAAAVLRSREITWDAEVIRAHAMTFAEDHFARRLREEIEALDTLNHSRSPRHERS